MIFTTVLIYSALGALGFLLWQMVSLLNTIHRQTVTTAVTRSMVDISKSRMMMEVYLDMLISQRLMSSKICTWQAAYLSGVRGKPDALQRRISILSSRSREKKLIH